VKDKDDDDDDDDDDHQIWKIIVHWYTSNTHQLKTTCAQTSQDMAHHSAKHWNISCMSKLCCLPLIRQWVVSLSAGRPRFNPRLVHMGTVVDKVAVGQGFLQILPSSPLSSHATNAPYSFIHWH